MITLINSRIRTSSPDLMLLQDFEQYCTQNSSWNTKQGPVLFAPNSISSRFYTAIHKALKPALKAFKIPGAIVSLGLPYSIWLYGKSFPYYSFNCDLRVLWTYDVWEPKYKEVEQLVRKCKIQMLLLSSYQATEYFRKLCIPDCEVHWLPETVNPNQYKSKPWKERSINVLSFGRSFMKYHENIVEGCNSNKFNYQYQERNQTKDVAVQGLKQKLQFPTWDSFVDGLADAQICICFPRCETHPQLAGNVSTLTTRYLQAMASKCLIIGSVPLDVKYLFDYSPIVEVDWNDPVGQIKHILQNPEEYEKLIQKNYEAVCDFFHHNNTIRNISNLVSRKLSLKAGYQLS